MLHLSEVKRPRKEPDNSIEEGLVTAVLGEDGQEVALQDLCGPQLLAHVSRLVLMPQVPDQILHTLFRENKTPAWDPRSQELPPPIRTQSEESTRPQSVCFHLIPRMSAYLSNLAPCGRCPLPSTQGHYTWREVHSSSRTSSDTRDKGEGRGPVW